MLVDSCPTLVRDSSAPSAPFQLDTMLDFGHARLPLVPGDFRLESRTMVGMKHEHFQFRGEIMQYQLFQSITLLLRNKELLWNSKESSAGVQLIAILFSKADEPGPSYLKTHIMPALLQLLAVSAWWGILAHLRQRLQHHRHQALIEPNRETFEPLTVLRRNIADVQNSITFERTHIDEKQETALKTLQEHSRMVGSRTFDNLFATLLREVQDISTALDHEVQLVIGAVTIQVSTSEDFH